MEFNYIKYMRARAAGTYAVRTCFDLTVAVHPAIVDPAWQHMGIRADCFYPIIPPQVAGAVAAKAERHPLEILFTGSMTDFRNRGLSAFLQSAVVEGGKFRLKIRGFVEDVKEYETFFGTLNIAQSEFWQHSSPVRIYRSLKYGLLPMVTKRFSDHLIEDLAVTIDFKTPQASEFAVNSKLASLEENVRRYNQTASEANDVILEKAGKLLEIQRGSTKDVMSRTTEFDPLELFGPVLVDKFRRGSVVEYLKHFYYVPKSLGNIHLESLDSIKELPELEKFDSKIEALLHGIVESYSNHGKTPYRMGDILGHDIIGVEGSLFTVEKGKTQQSWIRRHTKLVYPMDYIELRVAQNAEDDAVKAHDDIISLVQTLLCSKTVGDPIKVCSTTLSALYWCGGHYAVVPQTLAQNEVRAHDFERFEVASNLLDGIKTIIRDGGSFSFEIVRRSYWR
ncbi:MAG: hypothetical protein VYA17_14695 [Pseudomonadota bacterium]|nr:hypothetical protein [Pseudomonadota bacterium]